MKRKILGVLLSVTLVFGSVDVTALAAEAAMEEDVIQDEEPVTEEAAEITETSDEKKEDNNESEEEQVSEEQQTVTEEVGEKYSAEATEETQTATVEVSEQESEETETVSSEEEMTEETTEEINNTADSGSCGTNLKWSYEGTTLTISGTGEMSYTGEAPWKGKLVESIVLEEGITSIHALAFQGFYKLSGSVVIPNSVTEIGSCAFEYCSGISGDLVIPNSVTKIGSRAFDGCTGLDGSLTIGSSVTEIGSSAFRGCKNLRGNLTIPNSVATIGEQAFSECSGLDGSLTIGNSVTEIGYSAFSGCSGLEGDLIIPDSVTEIGAFAFWGCSGLDGSLKIPKGLTNIGGSAFSNCSGLTGNLKIPEGITDISGLFSGCSGLSGDLIIPDSVTELGGAFKGCSGLTGDLKIPEGVTSISESTFEGCSGLTGDLIIPKSVTLIEYDAFKDCANLGDVYISNFDTKIAKHSSGDRSAIFQFKENTKTKIYAPIYSEAWQYAIEYEDYYEFIDWGEHGIKEVTVDFAGWEVSINSGLYEYDPSKYEDNLADTVYLYIYAYDKDDNYLTKNLRYEMDIPDDGIIDISSQPLEWNKLPTEAAFVRVIIERHYPNYPYGYICATSDRIERKNYPEVSFQLNEVYSLAGSLMLDVTMLGEMIFLGDDSTTKGQSFAFELSYGEQEEKDSWTEKESKYEAFSNNSNSSTIQITGLKANKTYYGELRIYIGDREFPSFETIFNLPEFKTYADESVDMASAFPDEVFRSLVQERLYSVTDKNNVALSDLEKVTYIGNDIRSFDVETIKSIKGIEYLTGLTSISLTNNEISDAGQVDWSKLKALERIDLRGNETKNAPDFSKNKKLTSVNFEENCMSVSETEKLLKAIPKGVSVNASPYTQRPEGLILVTEPVYYDDEIIVRVHGYKTGLPYTLQFYLDNQQVDFTDGWSGLWRAADSKLTEGKHTVKVELLKQDSVEGSKQNTFEIKEEDYFTEQDKIYFSSNEHYNYYYIDNLFYSNKITASITGIDIADSEGNVVASSQYTNAYAYSSRKAEKRYTNILEDGSGRPKYINYAYGGLKTEDNSSILAGEYDVVLKFSDDTQHIYKKLVIVTGDDIPVISKLAMYTGPYDNSGDYAYLMLYTASIDPEKLAYSFRLGGREFETKYISYKEVYNGIIVKLQKVDWIDSNRMNYQNVEVSVTGKDGYAIKGGSSQTVEQVCNGYHYVAYNEITKQMEITFSVDRVREYSVGKKVVIPLQKQQNGTYVDTEITGTTVVQEGITKFDLVDTEGNPVTLEVGSNYNPRFQNGQWGNFTVKSTTDRIRNNISIKDAKDYPITVKVYRPNDAQYIVKRTINNSDSIQGDYYNFTNAFVESLEENGIYQVVVSDGKNRYIRNLECFLRVGDETTDDSNMLDIRPENSNPDNPGHQHDYAQEWSSDATNHWHECSCGDKKDTSAHSESDWITDKSATVTEVGKQHTECTVCGRLLQEKEIPVLDPDHEHNYAQEWSNDAENHWHECSCGAKNEEAVHTESDWITDKEATKTEKGKKHTECTICKRLMQEEEIPIFDPDHEHNYTQKWSGNNEKHWHECSCGAKIDEAAHEESGWIIDKEATAAEAGKKHTECTVCKRVLQQEEIPSSGISNPDKAIKISEIPTQQYTGSELTPAVTVTAGETVLKEGIDYRITYINATDVYLKGNSAYAEKASPKAKITMLGEYSGIYTKNFDITPVSLTDESAVCITAASAVETKKAQKIAPYVYFNGMRLQAGKDYTLSYPSEGNYTNAGLWSVTVSAVSGGNFVGKKTVAYEIIGKDDREKYPMSKASIRLDRQKFTYTGAACEPAVTVSYGRENLQPQDYEVLYYHNINAGTATVVIVGKGKYVGTQEKKYKIEKASVKNAEITGVPANSVVYSGEAVTFDNITVKCDGQELVKGRDYTVSYKNNSKAGNATVVVIGKGNYSGSKSVKFKISAAELKANYATTKGKAQYSPKGAILSDLKITLNGNVLTEGRDYKVSYKNNKKVTAGEKTAEATIKGINGCWGSFTLKYEIEPADFSDVTIVTSDVVYADKAGNYKTKIKVYDASGKQLAEKKQYIIERYSKADGTPVDDTYKAAVGEQITIKITPKEGDKNYKEGTSAVCTYKIVRGLMSKAKISALTAKSLSKDDVTELSAEDFSGKVKIGKDTLKYGTDFEIAEGSFTDTDKPGNATVTLIGKGEYGGTKVVKYKITK